MADHRQDFHDALTAVSAAVKENRRGALPQRKPNALITDWHRSRLLTLQAAYMLMTPRLQGEAPVRHDETSLEAVKAWLDTLPVRTLFDAYQAHPDPRLLICLVGLYVEYCDMAAEFDRRLRPKRFTVEMMRAGWGDEDRTDVISKYLNAYKTDKFAKGLHERALKDPANEPEDLDQSTWERAWELFEQRSRQHTDPPKPLVWFDSLPLQPHEAAFFNGPVATAWTLSLPKVLADLKAQLTGQTERLPMRIRYAKEAVVEKIERERALTDADTMTVCDKDGKEVERSRGDEQAFRDWERSDREQSDDD